MTNVNQIRRAIRGRLRLTVPLFAAAVLLVGSQRVTGAEPAVSANAFDRQMADLAILASPDPETTPMLMVLEADSPAASTARLAVLRRDDAWVTVASTEIDLGADDLTARWLVRLDDDRFALIATSPQSAPGAGRAVVIGLAVDREAGGIRIDEGNRQTFDRAIEDAGAADVDGFGSAELVLGMRPMDTPEACGTSTLAVLDGSIVSVRRSIDIPGPRGAGVLGRFDAVPGAELLIYASAGCPPGGDPAPGLLAIRLADGSQSLPIGLAPHGFATGFPAPLLIDVDGSAPDEVLATADAGVAAFDPSRAWERLIVAETGSVGFVAGPGGVSEPPGARIAVLEAPAGQLLVGRLQRGEGGLHWSDSSRSGIDDTDPSRSAILLGAIVAARHDQTAPTAWVGDAFAEGCPDVVLPGAIFICGNDDPQWGPGWLATRPITAMSIDGQRRILVAAGMGPQPEVSLPASPTPAATGPTGWWRHGPSSPFVLTEVSPDALVWPGPVPPPTASIVSTTAADGIARLRGPAGTRFFATVTPLAEGKGELLQGSGRFAVRAPVLPGSGSDGAESVASFGLGELRLPGDVPANSWAIRVVPINDVGEAGQIVVGTITPDDVAPIVVVDEPFTSAIWPSFTELVGRSDPGSTVRVDGIGEVDVDASGGFVINTQLAPWPQAFRITATDPAGNHTVASFSVVGGIDYRRFPWPAIAAAGLLALVTWRGLFGGRRARASGAWVMRSALGTVDDDELLPVIEELPPGSGLARR